MSMSKWKRCFWTRGLRGSCLLRLVQLAYTRPFFGACGFWWFLVVYGGCELLFNLAITQVDGYPSKHLSHTHNRQVHRDLYLYPFSGHRQQAHRAIANKPTGPRIRRLRMKSSRVAPPDNNAGAGGMVLLSSAKQQPKLEFPPPPMWEPAGATWIPIVR